MANTILIQTLVESGVNTQSWLLKCSIDAAGGLQIPHTLRVRPVWAQVIQAKESITGLPATSRVYPSVIETPPAPNGTSLDYTLGGNYQIGTGTLWVDFTAPAMGQTEIVHFTLHLGRTHSRAR